MIIITSDDLQLTISRVFNIKIFYFKIFKGVRAEYLLFKEKKIEKYKFFLYFNFFSIILKDEEWLEMISKNKIDESLREKIIVSLKYGINDKLYFLFFLI